MSATESRRYAGEPQASFGAAAALPAIIGTLAALRVHGPDGGPWEAEHPAGGNGDVQS